MDRAKARIDAACTLAESLILQPCGHAGAQGRGRSRRLAIGDPQASFRKLASILAHHDLLAHDGRLAEDVSLLSAGDHFDYDADPSEVASEGLKVLRWLAAHPDDQVIILAGNHDLSRVMEFARMTDDRFEQARVLAREISQIVRSHRESDARLESLRERFANEFPDIPAPRLVTRDYLAFTEAQRSLVQTLLQARRLRLAQAARALDGRDILITHASVIRRDLEMIDLASSRDPAAIADGLAARLERAVSVVERSWKSGDSKPLDLRPLHVAGTTGREGGGLLYHRPANLATPGPNPSRDRNAMAPRRYDPSELPAGLLQAAGHTGHRSCLRELSGWISPAAAAVPRGGLRTLRTDGATVSYDMGLHHVGPDEAGVYLIDGEMNFVGAEDYPLFEVREWIQS